MKSLKIRFVRSLGQRKVYDIEMPTGHNFVLRGGAVAHNCSHAASYATVAYQCMFLKHHFPLEWWTSVLQNAKTEDIRDKGYAHTIKDLLVLPHVNGPMDTFELREGKVHAPLYLIDGIGDAACRTIRDSRTVGGDFKSFQDFYERVEKSAVDKGIMHSLILCGAFNHLSTLSPKDLLWFYHVFRRVQELKIGKGKTGAELLGAVEQYMASGKPLDVPELYADQVELEVKRLSLLPIYRLDVHDHFRKMLEHHHFLYDGSGLVSVRFNRQTVRVIRNAREIETLKNYDVGWVGLLRSTEEFRYKDKKTNQQVTALKCQIVNDGDSLECILWPNLYQELGPPPAQKIIFAKGILRESREPGKWSLFVQALAHF